VGARFFACRLCKPTPCLAVWFAPGAFTAELADWDRDELGPREYHALATRNVGREPS
jgi:hypothetical protein